MLDYLSLLKDTLIAAAYKPLVNDAPFSSLNDSASLGDYINGLYKMSLGLGATLGVLLIAYAGFEYMTTDAITKKKDGIRRIRQAVIGLLMLFGTYLIFNQIDPTILDLKVGGK